MSNQKKADQMLDDAIQKALRPRSSSTPPSPRCPSCGGWRNDPHPGCADPHHPNLDDQTDRWFQDFIYRAKLTARQSQELRSHLASSPPPPSPTQEELHFKMFPSTREGYDQAVAFAKHSPATPSSPETRDELKGTTRLSPAPASPPAELTEALLEYAQYVAALTQGRPLTAYQQQGLPDTSRLLALYTRQREEIERQEEDNVDLSSQLERLKAEQQEAEDSVASWRRLYAEERDALDLIAMRDTLTDVCQLLDGWHQDGTAWTKWDEEVRQRASTQLKSVYEKLRCLSSDSGTGGEK